VMEQPKERPTGDWYAGLACVEGAKDA